MKAAVLRTELDRSEAAEVRITNLGIKPPSNLIPSNGEMPSQVLTHPILINRACVDWPQVIRKSGEVHNVSGEVLEGAHDELAEGLVCRRG